VRSKFLNEKVLATPAAAHRSPTEEIDTFEDGSISGQFGKGDLVEKRESLDLMSCLLPSSEILRWKSESWCPTEPGRSAID